jgi:RNA polymerase sigma-70 factor, ECF subfamily
VDTYAESEAVCETESMPKAAIRYEDVSKLIESQYSGLINLLRRQLKDRELAADLINEAIAVALEHAREGRLTELERIGGYVFKISMNLLRNHNRHHANRPDKRVDPELLANVHLDEVDNVESAQLRQRAKQLIESLQSTRDREVVRRFYLDEESKESICESMAITPLQFTQIMSRARQRMKKYFDAQGLKHGDYFSLILL